MAFELPALPYAKDALAPHMSAQTLEFHHGKHHNTYVTNLNNLTKDTPLATKSLEEVIHDAWSSKNMGVFNNAAQVWNHTFFWNCMKPNGGGEPTGKVGEKIASDLGGYAAFKEKFSDAAKTQFGSGWAWLVVKDGKLDIMKTPNAENPMVHGATALLTIDVWEHAYYLDFQNRRPDFVTTFLDHLVNWDFVNQQLEKAGA
ncbi:superoxide dismutase [Caenispirillum bisanense]|uniref:Superoxide dismutase n=1 Tax=Caenispirillum bisanense TaxID=414052 RepID=A0A286GER2_9PROT|nr:superoxide dismutase [Caenispirillum bisanense]MCA1971923.1 superoxide dismutase [Caenispirillum sp.]SOD93992.1 superoxide dismutase, Fe-Mn family [Caenispirillum bisanense]